MQGVGFRWWARRRAEALGLSGTVENLPDGSVEAVVSGSEDAIESFAEMCRTGPAHARVDSVSVTPPSGRGGTAAEHRPG